MAYFPNAPVVTVPATPWILSDIEVPITWGPFYFGSARYICGFRQASPFLVEIIKSTDDGATWVAQDTGNLPDIDWNFGPMDFAADLVNGFIHILGFRSGDTANNLSYCRFNMNTDTYGASVDGALRADPGSEKLGIQADGTPIAFFTKRTGAGDGTAEGNNIQYSVIDPAGGSFGAAVDFVAGIANRVIYPLSIFCDTAGTLQVCYQNQRATDLTPQQIRQVSLTSGLIASGTTLIYQNPGPVVWNRHYAVGRGTDFDGSTYWGVHDQNEAAALVFQGTPSAAPVWTKIVAASLPGVIPATSSHQVHMIELGGQLTAWWIDQLQDATSENVSFSSSADGVTFGSPVLAWDILTNLIAGAPEPPESVGWFSIESNPTGIEMAANAYIDEDFNQSIVFLAPEPLALDCNNPPAGRVGDPYSHALSASGGVGPYTYEVTAGSLPAGLSLNAATGTVSGKATTAGQFSFTVQVTDSLDNTASVNCQIVIYAREFFYGVSAQLVCDQNYPWIVPPGQRIPWKMENSITAPAVGVFADIWTYAVPDNFYLVLDRIRHGYGPGQLIEGAGGILFAIDINSPQGNILLNARPLAQFISSVGSLQRPWPVGPVQIRGGDVLRYKIQITDPTIPTGPPNIIYALAEGWLYPVPRNV